MRNPFRVGDLPRTLVGVLPQVCQQYCQQNGMEFTFPTYVIIAVDVEGMEWPLTVIMPPSHKAAAPMLFVQHVFLTKFTNASKRPQQQASQDLKHTMASFNSLDVGQIKLDNKVAEESGGTQPSTDPKKQARQKAKAEFAHQVQKIQQKSMDARTPVARPSGDEVWTQRDHSLCWEHHVVVGMIKYKDLPMFCVVHLLLAESSQPSQHRPNTAIPTQPSQINPGQLERLEQVVTDSERF